MERRTLAVAVPCVYPASATFRRPRSSPRRATSLPSPAPTSCAGGHRRLSWLHGGFTRWWRCGCYIAAAVIVVAISAVVLLRSRKVVVSGGGGGERGRWMVVVAEQPVWQGKLSHCRPLLAASRVTSPRCISASRRPFMSAYTTSRQTSRALILLLHRGKNSVVFISTISLFVPWCYVYSR